MGSGFRTFQSGEVLTAANVQDYLMDQSVQVFAGTAALGSAIGTAVEPGMVAYLTDSDQIIHYRADAVQGTAWQAMPMVGGAANVVINGAMQVAQRGTSTASITTSGYYTADRFAIEIATLGTWTQTVENDAPTGSGFRKSLKMNCTTADASPAAGDLLVVAHRIEGQNLQQFLKGTASAKQFVFSFWVKGTTTGTYICELEDADNSRSVSVSYAINAANTWEKKTITFPADTTGAFDNDNAKSLTINFWLGAGSTYTSGTLATTWGSITSANRAVGVTNLAGATNRSWQITGVQLEAGSVATPFEFEDYGTTLAKCQRYYQKSYNDSVAPATVTNVGSVIYDNVGGGTRVSVPFCVKMRGSAAVTFYNPATGTVGETRNTTAGTNATAAAAIDPSEGRFGFDSGVIASGAIGTFHWVASAEL